MIESPAGKPAIKRSRGNRRRTTGAGSSSPTDEPSPSRRQLHALLAALRAAGAGDFDVRLPLVTVAPRLLSIA